MAIQTVLDFNADPLLLNGAGLQPLERMLHIALKSCHCQEPSPCIATSQSDAFIAEYQNDYATLAEAIAILLQHGAAADKACSFGHTPLLVLLQCFLHQDFLSLIHQADSALAAVKILLSNGANPNFVTDDHGTTTTLLALICRRLFTDASIPRDADDLKKTFATFTNNLLKLLLTHGLDPNHISTRSSPFLHGGIGNALIDFVRLAEIAFTQFDFACLRMWCKTLLQWGANPDLEPYPSEPIICHSQSSIFLKKQGTQPVNHYLHEIGERQSTSETLCEQGMKELLYLFYNTMNHTALFHCLQSVPGLSHIHGSSQDFLSTVHTMLESPRSLKQIARVAIYKAVHRRIEENVSQLPVPWIIKQYLVEIL